MIPMAEPIISIWVPRNCLVCPMLCMLPMVVAVTPPARQVQPALPERAFRVYPETQAQPVRKGQQERTAQPGQQVLRVPEEALQVRPVQLDQQASPAIMESRGLQVLSEFPVLQGRKVL